MLLAATVAGILILGLLPGHLLASSALETSSVSRSTSPLVKFRAPNNSQTNLTNSFALWAGFDFW